MVGVTEGTATAPGMGTEGTVVGGITVVDGTEAGVALPGAASAHAGVEATRGTPTMAKTTSLLTWRNE